MIYNINYSYNIADHAADDVSERYVYLDTAEVIDALQTEGWRIVHTQRKNKRNKSKLPYAQHLFTLRKPETKLNNVEDILTEIHVVNSHDGRGALKTYAGLFRIVCLNGLVLPDGIFGYSATRHINKSINDAIEAAETIAKSIPDMEDRVRQFQAKKLSADKEIEFAVQILNRLYPNEDRIDPEDILRSRRYADGAKTVWLAFQRMQENIIKGGITLDYSQKDGRRIVTKVVKSIPRRIKINQTLWSVAEEYI